LLHHRQDRGEGEAADALRHRERGECRERDAHAAADGSILVVLRHG